MIALIINYNRLFLPKKMADYLAECNIEPIFVDNNSTYEPLLEYYNNCSYKVINAGQNYGHTVIWDSNILDDLKIKERHIITDSDLDISEIPKDFLEILEEGLNKYPKYDKCGFSLKINDLPDTELSKHVIEIEKGYWTRPLDELYYDASIDTTFALCSKNFKTFNSIRTNNPYIAKHVPWYYTDFTNLSEDEKYYINSISKPTYWTKRLKEKFI